ncbi:MAG: nucleotide exchange factor GrpE [Rhodospirillales bacterium]|jgi:molecular chaperone GrpE|nr:nucleotide exchange factor GrpE [Rhodospirillaceae bacterium]MDP6642603.1 nucleotide exchange factor GrpE [Rhodospirillales bacterium]MDP6840531.1 nucleotide exchange factor GrpE [Rhodospirillales bacterium]
MTDDQDQNPDAAEEPKDEGESGAEEKPENDTESEAETKFEFDIDKADALLADAVENGAAADAGAAEDIPPTYEELEASVADLNDQLLRALADTENTRRRAERDKADTAKYATANMARAILSVADNLDRAMASVSEEAKEADEELKNLCIGIELTETELVNAFEQFGITPIEAMGKKFDHNFHQAMFELEDLDQPAGTVIQEVQKGYVIHDRLLRPSMVGVAKGGPKGNDKENNRENNKDDSAEDSAEDGDEAKSGPASAYEKQSDAADREADGSEPQVDKKL